MDDWMIAIKDKQYRDKLLDEYGLANANGA